ncbi:hypothetical protein MMC17_009798 [Xylographa soralifera]|nr:hypothetical protein [Xylographa soralifera]
MARNQASPTRVTKHQTPTRKSARLKSIQHPEERMDSRGQNTELHLCSSASTHNTRNSSSPAYERPSCPDQRLSQERKPSQGIEDLVSQTKDQPIDSEREARENEDHHQLPSPSTSNLHEQSSGKKKRRAGSIKSCSEEINNHYPKRRKVSPQAQQTVQFQETVPETNSPVFERVEERPKASESKEKEKDDPISYWAANHTWPNNFAEFRAMPPNDNNKRPRTSDYSQSTKEGKPPSYTQARKDGDVPEPYTKAYEKYLFTQGLDMDEFKAERLVSPDSKVTCKDLQKITCMNISPTVYSTAETLEVVKHCRNRNEAMVNRDVTPLIVPPIKSLHLKEGGNHFEHLTDEVNTQWHESWVLTGPRPKPDLAVGFFSSAFTIAENAKLTNYTSFENLTRPTDELCFPFLMCEVKCGNEGLDFADRQNMHSCSVAVKALLKLEQKADQYREVKQFESLLGKILVYSISHDQKNARVYGHYALVEGEKWTYYRHHIDNFDILYKVTDLLALHNFARNVVTVYAPKLLKRLREAFAALPASSTLPFSVDTMNLEDDSQRTSQHPSQGRDTEGFALPGLPANAQRQMDKLLEEMEQRWKESTKEKDELGEQNANAQKQMDKLLQQLEQQGEESKQTANAREQMDKLLLQLKQQGEESKKEKDELSKRMDKLLQQMEQQGMENKKEKDELREQNKELMNMLKHRPS